MEVDWERRYKLIKQRQLAPEVIERLINDLKADGLRLKETTYRDQMGGSWYFVFCGEACVRAAFDGRDGCLHFEVWRGRKEYELGTRSAGRWDLIESFNPDVTDASVYSPEAIRDEVKRLARAASS